jgi:hypothetical protein
MEHGVHAIERDSNARAAAFGDRRSRRLNIASIADQGMLARTGSAKLALNVA